MLLNILQHWADTHDKGLSGQNVSSARVEKPWTVWSLKSLPSFSSNTWGIGKHQFTLRDLWPLNVITLWKAGQVRPSILPPPCRCLHTPGLRFYMPTYPYIQ